MVDWLDTIQDWDSFFGAYTERLCTEFYGENYPGFREYCDETGCKMEVVAKTLLEKGLNAQEGLDNWFLALIEGNRYAAEELNKSHAIEEFLKYGATVSYDILFKSYVDAYDEFVNAHVQGRLIDLTHHYGLDPFKYADWKAIEAVHWEEADQTLDKALIEKMTLKHSSKYLQSL